MKKQITTMILLGIIGIIFVGLIFFIYSINKSNTTKKEQLTNEDFKILSASWDYYLMEYGDRGLRIKSPQTEINWNYGCGLCKSGEIDCMSASWSMEVYASEDLSCNKKVDGIIDNKEISGLIVSGSLINKGQTTTPIEFTNLDITKSHEIVVCCQDFLEKREGEICKSITLLPKC